MDKFQGWIASLDNGETVHEEWIEGQESPWQALIKRVRKGEVRITQLRLQRGGITLVALANALGYVQATEKRMSVNTGNEYEIQGIGYVIGDAVILNWINDTGHVWQDIRPLKSMLVHSTLQ